MQCIQVFRKIFKLSSHNVPVVRPMERNTLLSVTYNGPSDGTKHAALCHI